MKLFSWRDFRTTMSSFTEYFYTARPAVPHCKGSSCYCFYGTNPLNDPTSDSEGFSQESSFSEPDSPWKIVQDTEWGVSLNETKFLHPRVLLAYFRFVCLHNEMAAKNEMILVPKIPSDVMEYIQDHISLREPVKEFLDEVNSLKFYLSIFQ